MDYAPNAFNYYPRAKASATTMDETVTVGAKLSCGAIAVGALAMGLLTGYLAGKAWGKQYAPAAPAKKSSTATYAMADPKPAGSSQVIDLVPVRSSSA